MKNKIIALALVTLGLVSCTNDDIKDTKGVATADISVDLKTDETQNSATAKNVNRGNLYSWIDDVIITATSKDFNHTRTETFDLVENGTSKHDSFDLSGVAVGHNMLSVETTTSTQPEMSFDKWSNNGAMTMWDLAKQKGVYAIYRATVPDFIVVQGGLNQIPTTELRTQHGRSLSIFQLSPEMEAVGAYARLTTIVDGVQKESFNVAPDLTSTVYWSDNNSTNGKVIRFLVDIKNNKDETVNHFETAVTIVASKSINKIFTIKDSGITAQTTSQTFTAQEWVNEDDVNATIGQ